MTEDEKDRELVFFGRKLEAVTKECERLKAENAKLLELADLCIEDHRRYIEMLGNDLIWRENRLEMIDQRRT